MPTLPGFGPEDDEMNPSIPGLEPSEDERQQAAIRNFRAEADEETRCGLGSCAGGTNEQTVCWDETKKKVCCWRCGWVDKTRTRRAQNLLNKC